MIRFIDLGEQIIKGYPEFVWYNTVICKFETFSGNQTWETWLEFETDHRHDETKFYPETYTIDRFKALFPKKWKEGK